MRTLITLYAACVAFHASAFAIQQTYTNGANSYAGTSDVSISNVYGGNGTTFRDVLDPVAKSASATEYHMLLKFDGLSVPAGQKVGSVSLRLSLVSWVSGVVINGYYLNSTWDAAGSGLGWLNRTPTLPWLAGGAGGMDQIAGKTFQITGLTAAGDQTVTVPLDPAVVQNWIDNPASNQGIVLVNAATDKWARVYSSRNTRLDMRPMLTISTVDAPRVDPDPVNPPPPPPPPPTGRVFEVGPGKPYTTIGSVPWATLIAGDTVLINWRSTPYAEKWVICRQGTAAAPIVVRGVPNASGQLPVITGANAVSAPGLSTWSEERALLKIGGANVPADTMPKYIVIENLDLRGAYKEYTFKTASGVTKSYTSGAAAVFIEKGENITIRNCTMQDSSNGLFIASSDTVVSRDILIEGNRIFNNGIIGSFYSHNSYTAAIGITFERNYFGPPRVGATGNNLKDRSAGMVARYNWIEGGNRQMDLVDGEDSLQIRSNPRYRETFVYGNVLIERDGDGNRQVVHYGGDSGVTAHYRKGTMYFYNNTVVSNRLATRTVAFMLSTNEEHCDARNNIFYTVNPGTAQFAMLEGTGILDLSHNWIRTGYVTSLSMSTFTGLLVNDGTNITGAAPGFLDAATQDFRLAVASPAINAGTALHSVALTANDVVRQYVRHQNSQVRPRVDTIDLGAFEF